MRKKYFFFKLLLSIILLGLSSSVVLASDTYTLDSNRDIIPTQDAYYLIANVSKFNLSNSDKNTLNQPNDIYYQEDLEKYYIADTKNKRVVVLNKDLTTGISVGEGILSDPQGVFATSDGDIYVADNGRKEVLKFSGDTYEQYGKPNHPLYGETIEFKPIKVAVDSNKTMYVVDAGNANGIVLITKEGQFSGYFGANYITPDFAFVVKFLFSSKEQRASLYKSPIAPTNIAFDYDGLLITVTSGLKGNALKRLNIAGNNMFSDEMFYSDCYVDVAVGPTGTLYTIDGNGYIHEFDKEGNILFIFGGKDTTGLINGKFLSPKSIEIDSNYNLYVLDKNAIYVFSQTEFADYVHQALTLYNDGKYEESHEPWQKVLQMNNMFDLAHSGLGNAYLREGNYEEALEEFKIAKNVNGYSEAYWEVRNEWLMNYTSTIIIIIGLLIVIIIVVKKVFSKQLIIVNSRIKAVNKGRIINEMLYLFKFIKKPLNGFYEIKHKQKMSSISATIWYVILFIIILLSNIYTGFVFNTKDIETISVLQIFSLSILPILLFVVANYLISSITVGSGKLKDVYIGTICSFAPVICFYPIVIILSNFLTLNESFVFTALTYVLWAWSFGLLYFMIKDIQELQVGENNKNIFLTILTMLLFVAFAFLLYVLGAQLFSFLKEIFVEVLANA